MPLDWPKLTIVARYFGESLVQRSSYLDATATGMRAGAAAAIGFGVAVALGLFTGRTFVGWLLFFILLLTFQKIPAVAMVHVFVNSRLGIGTVMTVSLAATVVLTFTWLMIHHRAATLQPESTFALRVAGLSGWRLALYGLLPHLGSTIGAAARLAVAIALVIVVIGEWQGIWADDSFWEHGLGVRISRAYEAVDSEARVLSQCLWLGLLGIILDGAVQGLLLGARRVTGVSFQR